jgi:tetratricopeptide (TPR) repeat protein
MNIDDQLRVLEDAQGDPAKLALAAVDLAYPAASVAERDALKQTLEAAAIPHWCNEAILAALLDLPPIESASRFTLLDRLREVERFEARGPGAINIHESARLAIRGRMAREEPERFRVLSGRAATYFATDRMPTGRVEWIYHRLCADPDAGAADCEVLVEEWCQSAYSQDRDALALALFELESTGLVDGRARVEVLLYYGTNQYEHSEIKRVVECAREALALAKETGHATGEADANDLLGQTLRIQGHLPEALEAFRATLKIYRDLAARNPADALSQFRLALAHSRLGDVYGAQNEFDKALESFRECARLCQTLTDEEPTNTRWQRETAASFIRVGDILWDQLRSTEARDLYERAQRIIRLLVEAEPDNADWQCDLAMTYWRVAKLYDVDHAKEAREALDEYLRLSDKLLSEDINNARRQADLALGYSSLGFLEERQKQFPAAQSAFRESRRIQRQLVERDPSNARWRLQLANACSGLGLVLRQQKELTEAQTSYEEALELLLDLSARDPGNLKWRRNLAEGLRNVATLNEMRNLKTVAVSHLEEASRIYSALVNAAPDNAGWAAEQKKTDESLARLRTSLDVSNPSSNT